ncbi:shikimate kinase [Clostridium beijerinckii]|uniref:Shikimate kinase n=1 Tax=Clostridium beijerinckii TaxID=1520 RepID=A0A9Q5GCT3_CLOBE|nr:shikimate kinase [Clostridium beijerinckii]AQS07442.1 shikimate kinase [Clostridium beijerinckii]MBA2884495.1 shikimate kinase [Clostridium beijerinckii]MBA2898135.1 shikimate kinase [Clostridium beijerinckii]MBA2909986.1 shikimate kinase [Clostridium beijerinckii]MBA9012923.1 shikimate kinase [Clostridium beijerinckii]
MKNNIIIIGMPGSGKTTFGKILAEELNIKFFDMDEYIQEKTGKTTMQLFENGEEYFRDIETETCKELMGYNDILISTGGGVIKRKINIDILKNGGTIIFLDRPVDKILEDVDVSYRPLLKDGKEKVIRLYEERYALYNEYADKIVINDKNKKTVIEEIKKLIEEVKNDKMCNEI